VLDEAMRHGHAGVVWLIRHGRVWCEMARNGPAAAEIDDVLSFGETHGLPWAYHTRMLKSFHQFCTADPSAAVSALRAVAAAEPPTSWAQTSRAILFFALAHLSPDEARRTHLAMPATLPAPDGVNALGTWANLGWTILGLDALGDHDAMAALDRLSKDSEVHTDMTVPGLVPLPLTSAMTAAAVGDWARAEQRFATARAVTEGAGIRVFSPRVLEAHADMLVRRNGAGEGERATVLYDRALDEYARYGLEVFARRLADKRRNRL
jgi:hypothetical protein